MEGDTASKFTTASKLALGGAYTSIIFDCDGVLWSGMVAIPHARDFLHLLIKQGIKPLFLTNTSLYGPQDIQHKLKTLMELDVPMEDIYTANVLAGQYVKQKLVPIGKKKAYVIGREVLVQEVKKSGIEVLAASEHNDKYGNFRLESPEGMDFKDVDVVVMGYDDNINLYKLAFATYAVQSGAVLLSTNADKNTRSIAFPDLKIISNGSFVKAIESASETTAIVAGKPNPGIFDMIKEVHGIDQAKTLFVGDNLYTDILFANKANIHSLLVLTGVTAEHNLQECLERPDSGSPTYISAGLA